MRCLKRDRGVGQNDKDFCLVRSCACVSVARIRRRSHRLTMNGLKVSFSLSSEADNWGKVASFAKILASKKEGPKVRILVFLTGFKPSNLSNPWYELCSKGFKLTWHNPWRVWCARPCFSWFPTRRGGSISIPEIAFSSIFSETGEDTLYLQECYLGRFPFYWFPFDLTYSAQLNYSSSSVVLRLAPNDGEVCFLSAGTTTSLIKRSEGRLLPLLQLTKILYYRVVLRPLVSTYPLGYGYQVSKRMYPKSHSLTNL